MPISTLTRRRRPERFNLADTLNQELGAGPLRLSLSDIGFTGAIQDKLNIINDALLAVLVIYSLAMGFSGLSMLANLGALVLPGPTPVVLANLGLGSLATVALFIGSLIVTIIGTRAAREINDPGNSIGLSASAGVNIIVLTWVAMAMMAVVVGFWLLRLVLIWRSRKAAASARGEK